MKCMARAELVSREAPTPTQLPFRGVSRKNEQFKQMVGHSAPPSSPHSWTSLASCLDPSQPRTGGGGGQVGSIIKLGVCAKDGVGKSREKRSLASSQSEIGLKMTANIIHGKRTNMLQSHIPIHGHMAWTRSDSRCRSFAGLGGWGGVMSLLVECEWRVRWQMCVRRFQGRNTVGENRGWDTWRHCHTRPRTEELAQVAVGNLGTLEPWNFGTLEIENRRLCSSKIAML